MAGLAGFLSFLIAAGFVWTLFGPLAHLATLLGLPAGWWLGLPAGIFLAVYLAANAFFALPLAALQLSGGGLWTASPVRWMVGKIASLLLLLGSIWFVGLWLPLAGFDWGTLIKAVAVPFHLERYILPFWVVLPSRTPPEWFQWNPFGIWQELPLGLQIAAGLSVGLVQGVAFWAKPALGRGTKPLRQIWQAMKSGLGGSSGFMGLLDEWTMRWKPGMVLLGTSLYEPGQRLGHRNAGHLVTIATTQSGKGRSCIIPNLLTWPGSALVIDPKGQNAAVTARARMQLGQDVHIVDPFHMLAGLGLDPGAFPARRLNPLAEIRLDDLDAVEQIRNLAAALVIPSSYGDPFWDNASRQILAGIISHVLTWERIADRDRHLGTVRDYVVQTNGRKLTDLALNRRSSGNLAAVAAAELTRASDATGGSILTTLNVHMQWLDSPAMREAMTESDFTFAELKHRESTVYLVIPPEYLEEHNRYLRLFITLALRAAGRGRRAKHDMLFILDEFPALGQLKVLSDAAGQLAGMGVKLWPIIQNITQIQDLYGRNWEVFLANAGQQQVFAMNDQTTARYFSERLGHHIAWRKVRTQQGYEWIPQGPSWLRTHPELARETSRDSNRALVFFEGGETAFVRRAAYDEMFTKEHYDPDPYRKEPPVFSRAAIRAEGGFEKWFSNRLVPWLEGAGQTREMDREPASTAPTRGDLLMAGPPGDPESEAFETAPIVSEAHAPAPPRREKPGDVLSRWRPDEPVTQEITDALMARDETFAMLMKAGKRLEAERDEAIAALAAERAKNREAASTPPPGEAASPASEGEAEKPALAVADDGTAPDEPACAETEISEDRPDAPLPKVLKAPPVRKPRKRRPKKTAD